MDAGKVRVKNVVTRRICTCNVKVRDSLGPSFTLDSDALVRALLAHRSTSEQLTGLSTAQVIFGKKISDFLPCSPGHYLPLPEQRLTTEQMEQVMLVFAVHFTLPLEINRFIIIIIITTRTASRPGERARSILGCVPSRLCPF